MAAASAQLRRIAASSPAFLRRRVLPPRSLGRVLITPWSSSVATVTPGPPARSTPIIGERSWTLRSSSSEAGAPLRRRRRRGAAIAGRTGADSRGDGSSSSDVTAAVPSSSSAFAPVDPEGNPLASDEYLALASLSPWVPCPDVVAKRAFEIAEVRPSDVHVDLGCGDGRLCFAADALGVERSWGVDVDHNVLERCRDRLARRFVPGGAGGDKAGLEFFQADLIRVVDRQRERYQNNMKGDKVATDAVGELDFITDKLDQSTLITMYFVSDALKQLKPYLASVLGGRENVRVITIGYEMEGWEASWVERVLGLTIFRYDMSEVPCDPVEWNDDDGEGTAMKDGAVSGKRSDKVTSLPLGFDPGADYYQTEDDVVAEYLSKRKQDLEELNDGLQINHDEALENFTHARQAAASSYGLHGDDGTGEEWDWDFDETEEPDMTVRETRGVMAGGGTGRRAGGAGSLMARKGGTSKRIKVKVEKESKTVAAKPVWKKP